MFVFYVSCNDCVGVCGNVCCVVDIVQNSVFKPWSEVCYMFCVKGVMDVVFSVCIVIRGAVGACV